MTHYCNTLITQSLNCSVHLEKKFIYSAKPNVTAASWLNPLRALLVRHVLRPLLAATPFNPPTPPPPTSLILPISGRTQLSTPQTTAINRHSEWLITEAY